MQDFASGAAATYYTLAKTKELDCMYCFPVQLPEQSQRLLAVLKVLLLPFGMSLLLHLSGQPVGSSCSSDTLHSICCARLLRLAVNLWMRALSIAAKLTEL